MSWKDTLVAIWTPRTSDDGVSGTGFPIAHDLVMTARHVVRPDCRDASRPIQVNWWYSDEDWQDLDVDDRNAIVWECEKHDVAVLRVPRPSDVDGFCFLTPTKPRDHAEWAGAGFSQADRCGDIQAPGQFIGNTLSMADKDRFFQVEALSTSPETAAKWRGASGMPVVVDGRVIGICCECPANYAGKKVSVSPIWQIWKDMDGCHKGIRAMLPYYGYVRELRENLIELICDLRLSEDVVKYLLDELYPLNPSLPRSASNSVRAGAIALVDAVSELLPSQVFWAFRRHTVKMETDQDTQVSAFVQAVAAFLFAVNGTEVSDLAEKARDGGGLLTNLPIGTCTMAEVLVAAAHKRSISFLPRRLEHELPSGTCLIPFKPVYRNSDTGGHVEAMILDELRQHHPNIMGDRCGDFESVFFDNLGSFFNETDAKGQCDFIRTRMKIEKDRTGLIPYMAFVLPENQEERNFIVPILERISQKVPEFFIMVLDKEFKNSDAEALSMLPYYISRKPPET